MSEQKKSSNNTAIVVIIIVVVLFILLVFVGFGIGGYYLYKIGAEVTPETITSAISSTTGNATVEIYINNRFGFSVTEPSGYSRTESQNGDGATFTNPANIEIRVFGTNNVESLKNASEYQDKALESLSAHYSDATEIAISEVQMGNKTGELRAWQYTDPLTNTQMIEEQAVCLSGDVFYVIEMTVPESMYSEYSQVFDDVMFSFYIK